MHFCFLRNKYVTPILLVTSFFCDLYSREKMRCGCTAVLYILKFKQLLLFSFKKKDEQNVEVKYVFFLHHCS